VARSDSRGNQKGPLVTFSGGDHLARRADSGLKLAIKAARSANRLAAKLSISQQVLQHGATIEPDYREGSAGFHETFDPWACLYEWEKRGKVRDYPDGVWHAES
jgi:hypothetical protein